MEPGPGLCGNGHAHLHLRPDRLDQGVPSEMFEAAKIDGASEWRIYNHIVVPLAFIRAEKPR
ncbi:MAG TPA: ABC transporter permease subunit, partial [Anaerolineae bacterium]|nr:ABC transporter permease subunit [Anaerolineae bacterium]